MCPHTGNPLFVGVLLSTDGEEGRGTQLWVATGRESSPHVRVQHIPPQKQGQLCPVGSSRSCLQKEVLHLVQQWGALGSYQHGDVLATGWDTSSCCSRQLPPLLPAAGTCGVVLRKVNGTAIVQLPSKRHMQVKERCCPWHDSLGTQLCVPREGCSSSLSPRCWRPVWPRWAACPTWITTSG